MNYNKVLIVGPHSSIASFILPELQIKKEKLFAITRRASDLNLPWVDQNHLFVTDYPMESAFMKKIVQTMCPLGNESVLVLNFAGFFGNPSTLRNMDINSVVDVLNKNSIQFLSIVKLLECFPPNSVLVGFSGGGVGGDNMDASSLGYLMSKISIAGIVEVLDKDFLAENKRIALIAPGAFPSEMQAAVANAAAGVVSEEFRIQAANVQADRDKISRLVRAIKWVTNNPNESGGRTWSAQRDDFDQESRVKRFGLLRRVFE